MNAMNDMASRLLLWFDAHGRHDLPWQHPRTPYRVWVSEVMLQQTQVATVIPYFERFVRELPTLRALAEADEDRVFALWSGLGYYRRARHLQQAARICVERHDGELPDDFDALAALPGIGRSTAGAILALARGQRHAILDGNVRRVLARLHGVRGDPRERIGEQKLWALAVRQTPCARVADYTQAIMDFGALVCIRAQPRCDGCPLSNDCIAYNQGLTEALPERRPQRALPQRRTVMLVLRDACGRVLLQKRGPSGVWSGLWSLPEAEDAEPARRAVERLADLRSAEIEVLAPFLHVFTHYRLEAQPLLWRNAKPHPGVADAPEQRWCAREEIAALGLPAPVRKLLDTIT
ncbi:MAG: A/G-specific adenine glycosylase [Rhodanobacteraceae bacterium]